MRPGNGGLSYLGTLEDEVGDGGDGVTKQEVEEEGNDDQDDDEAPIDGRGVDGRKRLRLEEEGWRWGVEKK
jgi:hypothetical protein